MHIKKEKREYGKHRQYKIIVRVTEKEKEKITFLRTECGINLSSLFRVFINDYYKNNSLKS